MNSQLDAKTAARLLAVADMHIDLTQYKAYRHSRAYTIALFSL